MTPSTETPKLTKNQTLVYKALKSAEEPLSAYSILDQLRDDGFRAPLQVYRALDKLIEFGLIHRLESINSFVACRHPDCGTHEMVAFAICESCNRVIEITDDAMASNLASLARDNGFSVSRSTIELRGLCDACRVH
ncbi:transcriptional repressor [Hoeflea sp. WL0058]|uniref:Ferric uptake regulation protein n=1 Tax=Flavimaribacter sediminis TaxID=2865987 RepID=A0AAE3CZS7_9HYPH|nr:Fur family transcriptional regulator [Flavimaribacter sediminis]MBW8636232.1 transcriptional repressor [Flavimaribacter sediminis]